MNPLAVKHYAEQAQKEYLNKLNEHDLKKRIQRYYLQDRRGWTPEQFRREIYRVLMAPNHKSFTLPNAAITVNRDSYVYRARRIDSPDDIQRTEDVMHVRHAASAGRLNKEGESLLYTADQMHTAFREVRSRPGDMVSITQFTVTKDFQLTMLGGAGTRNDMPMTHRRKMEAISAFLTTLISQSEKYPDEPDYAETEFVTKDLFDLPPEVFTGWAYPSFVSKKANGMNYAFRPEQAESVLKIDAVILGNIKEIDDTDAIVHFFKKMHPTADGLLRSDDSFV